ncbi:MAG TPA: hypothetical protein PLX23_07575 [Candidatus Hydrogenedens sp.]|nr:hypothetical protein [Candidatus Hydrogenedens sp.]
MEIRIFYECLEQARHYILPVIEKSVRVLKINCEIKLVKSVRNTNFFSTSRLQGIHRLTIPDFLITIINNGIEKPLIIGEFSEAVSTEDHELQREYGSVAAYLSNIIFLKISGNKSSEKEHGGANYNRYTTPKIYKEQFDYYGYIIAEWPTLKDNANLLKRNSNYLSCPPRIKLVEATILKTLEAYVKNPDSTNIVNNIICLLNTVDCYKEFCEKVHNAPGLIELEQNWRGRMVSEARRRYWIENACVKVKIYRFSHAMDPDRGILTFISLINSFSKNVFIVYNLEGIGQQRTINTIQDVKLEFIEKLGKDKMPNWFISEMRKVMDKKELAMSDEIDITDIWKQRIDKIKYSKVLTTIIYFSDGMYLNRNGPLLRWDRRTLLGSERPKFVETLRKIWGFDTDIYKCKLVKVSNTVDEDEVTYTIVHKILRPNNFKIIGVSYPGAQGSTVILPETDKGREQKRQYYDIIALPPSKSEKIIEPLIEESKGMFNENNLSQAINKLIEIRKSSSAKNTLENMFKRLNAEYRDSQILHILIGVGFGINCKIKTIWNPGMVDFIVRLENRKKWSIGIFNQKLLQYIPKISGKTNLPGVYEIAPVCKIKKMKTFYGK